MLRILGGDGDLAVIREKAIGHRKTTIKATLMTIKERNLSKPT